jgi:hypothetical protein
MKLSALGLSYGLPRLSEAEIARRYGVAPELIAELFTELARRKLAPQSVERMLIDSLGTLRALEGLWAGRGVKEARGLVRRARRQQARVARLILERHGRGRP